MEARSTLSLVTPSPSPSASLDASAAAPLHSKPRLGSAGAGWWREEWSAPLIGITAVIHHKGAKW